MHFEDKSHSREALLIPEILALVLSYLDTKSLACTARVSRLWNSAASDHLWHDLNGITRLFRVFGPLVAGNCRWPGLELVPDGSGNPRRFLDLAKKARSLNQAMRADAITVNSFKTVKSHFDTEIDCLFPGLRHFRWTAEAGTETLDPWLFAFLCPTSIRTFKLTVQTWSGIKDAICINMFHTIGGILSTSLTAFEVRFFPCRYKCDARGSEIIGVVSRWKNLTSLSLREIYIEPAQAELLLRGQLPLQQLTLSVLDSAGPSLSHVSGVLAQNYTSLRCLHLYMDQAERDPIEFRHLANLLACRSLTELQIFHSCAIHIDADAVHRMGANWRDMEILNLVTIVHDDINRADPTPCCRLLDFAAAMPKLEKLGMFFSYADVPSTFEHPSHAFQRLRVLGVGPAGVHPQKVPRLGQFLRAICPPGAKIACSHDSLAETVFDPGWNWLGTCWIEVQNMMDSGR